MTPETDLVLFHCPGCGYELTGLPREHSCPECGVLYDASMFDLPPHRGVGRVIWIRQHIWIDWIIRPLLYGLIPVGLFVAAVEVGAPVEQLVRSIATVAFLGLATYLAFKITSKLEERRSRNGTLAPTATRTADPEGITRRMESGVVQRFRWRSYRKASLKRLGEYPETGQSHWRLKLYRRLRLSQLLQNNISLTLACDEPTARAILDRSNEWIRAARPTAP